MDVVDLLSKPVSIAELECAMDRAWTRHVLVQVPVDDLLLPQSASRDDAFVDAPDGLVSRSADLDLEAMERVVIMEALQRSEDNRGLASKMLGISERTLHYRLSQYRLR